MDPSWEARTSGESWKMEARSRKFEVRAGKLAQAVGCWVMGVG
ncbi:hypothetical protein QYS49_32685 [Marivirga salinae]|uniref:Uncharacterized protein n=1 Tax=Marivirga salinarum TaxID=3059078 RepID=A0AA51NB92_9BACT|nr:hypothetical protein [Marivirga sp. BDSF4-3]WMN12172.1 hypothetical protein QYS49_32685 [Marivirga sp. BDSF4-3]